MFKYFATLVFFCSLVSKGLDQTNIIKNFIKHINIFIYNKIIYEFGFPSIK